LFMDVIAN